MSSNEQIIRQQINTTLTIDQPYYCPSNVFRSVQTDINEFPYQRYYRGKPDVYYPIVWEREAGYQRIKSSPSCQPRPGPETDLTNLCFQIPCSTVLPCNPQTKAVLSNQNNCVYISP